MYAIVFLVILTGGLLAFVENDEARRVAFRTYLAFAVPCLFLVAATRVVGVDADSPLYLGWYTGVVSDQMGDSLFSRDPAFVFVSLAVHTVGLSFSVVLAVYTALCMAAQMLFLRAAVYARWLPLGLFLVLARYYIPHEMTQIRASVAIPLMSLAVLQFCRGRKRAGCLLAGTALFFHLSTLLVIPVCVAVAVGARFETKTWLRWIAVGAVLLHFAFARLTPYLLLFSRLSDYVNGNYELESGSLLSLYLLLRVGLLLFIYLAVWEKLQRTERVIVICSTIGIALEISLSSNAAFSIRSGEVFGMFDVAAAMLILQHIRRRFVPVYGLVLLALGTNFYRSSTKIIEPYRSVWVARLDGSTSLPQLSSLVRKATGARCDPPALAETRVAP